MLSMLNKIVLHAQVMLDDVCAAYDALRISKTPRLPMVRLQYPDFATWQARQLLSSSVLHQVRLSKALLTACPIKLSTILVHWAQFNIW